MRLLLLVELGVRALHELVRVGLGELDFLRIDVRVERGERLQRGLRPRFGENSKRGRTSQSAKFLHRDKSRYVLRYPHSSRVARRAPSVIALNLAHTTVG